MFEFTYNDRRQSSILYVGFLSCGGLAYVLDWATGQVGILQGFNLVRYERVF